MQLTLRGLALLLVTAPLLLAALWWPGGVGGGALADRLHCGICCRLAACA